MGEFVIKSEELKKKEKSTIKENSFPEKLCQLEFFFSDFKFYLSAIFGKLELFSAFL